MMSAVDHALMFQPRSDNARLLLFGSCILRHIEGIVILTADVCHDSHKIDSYKDFTRP